MEGLCQIRKVFRFQDPALAVVLEASSHHRATAATLVATLKKAIAYLETLR